MAEIQQSDSYANFISSLNWHVERIAGIYIYIKKFPLIKGLAKIQRADTLPDTNILIPLLEKYQVKTIAIEPTAAVRQQKLNDWCRLLPAGFSINKSPFLATKTTIIDLSKPETVIFSKLTEAKRRAVRRAQKAGVTVEESFNINDMIRIKNNSLGLFGFIATYGIDKLWQAMTPKSAAILIARKSHQILAGLLLLFDRDTAYYWLTGSISQGKKAFAPTLLAWEAIRCAKSRGYKRFDFVGVWDERTPEKNIEWKGFTKFKQGFNGKSLYYPIANYQPSTGDLPKASPSQA